MWLVWQTEFADSGSSALEPPEIVNRRSQVIAISLLLAVRGFRMARCCTIRESALLIGYSIAQ